MFYFWGRDKKQCNKLNIFMHINCKHYLKNRTVALSNAKLVCPDGKVYGAPVGRSFRVKYFNPWVIPAVIRFEISKYLV